MGTLQHTTACLMVDYSDEMREGDRVNVTSIGSINQSGYFSVRILPDRDGLQDIMLQNISNSLEWVHNPNSLHGHDLLMVGKTCCPIVTVYYCVCTDRL